MTYIYISLSLSIYIYICISIYTYTCIYSILTYVCIICTYIEEPLRRLRRRQERGARDARGLQETNKQHTQLIQTTNKPIQIYKYTKMITNKQQTHKHKHKYARGLQGSHCHGPPAQDRPRAGPRACSPMRAL